MKSTSFAQIVSGTPSVTSAFASHPLAQAWWKVILWLHGKPRAPHLTASAKRHIIADGFRFYAQLYRFLGALFWLVSLAALLAGVFATTRNATYWTGAGTVAGAFLWLSSGLGFAGAKAYREGQASGRVMLCTFMVGIIAFLAAFTAFASLSVQLQTGYSPALNLAVVGAVAAVGIGSYLIEVVYLVAENELISLQAQIKPWRPKPSKGLTIYNQPFANYLRHPLNQKALERCRVVTKDVKPWFYPESAEGEGVFPWLCLEKTATICGVRFAASAVNK